MKKRSAIINLDIKDYMIDGKELFVIDGLFINKEIQVIYDDVISKPYFRTECDSKSDPYPVFASEFDITKANSIFDAKISLMTKRCFPDEQFIVGRSYVNHIVYGDMEFPHTDCREPKKNVTALCFVNKKWDYRWGGETKFFDKKKEIVQSVVPRPGRLVLFRGAILHCATVQTRICKESRLTWAIKMVDKKSVGNGHKSTFEILETENHAV
ncbi:MAG: 2OG-Fe(II) oxygenase [Gammaproteobacteria bacterium]|nr:2OG-Fe(II) oxygenase [Gammaproteobacteria bacterium]